MVLSLGADFVRASYMNSYVRALHAVMILYLRSNQAIRVFLVLLVQESVMVDPAAPSWPYSIHPCIVLAVISLKLTSLRKLEVAFCGLCRKPTIWDIHHSAGFAWS